MILFRSLAKILVALALISVILPDRPAQAITRVGNSRATTIKVNKNKLAESRVGNGITIDQKQPSRKISGHLVGNDFLKR
ncbi:hypothetical protein [Nostoc sp.]|uniref:hypothetical protein n=1 Tax=Nostoc sp. TaxID=1180 RepID=UPI002FF6335A